MWAGIHNSSYCTCFFFAGPSSVNPNSSHPDDGEISDNDYDTQLTQPSSNISDSGTLFTTASLIRSHMVPFLGSSQVDNVVKDVKSSCECRTRCTGKKSCQCKKLGRSCSKYCHPGRSCTNKICPSLKSNQSIQVEEYCTSNVQPLLACKGLNLTTKDKSVILNGEWLNDIIISAFQRLLKDQFANSSSLQDTVLGRSFQFQPCKKADSTCW